MKWQVCGCGLMCGGQPASPGRPLEAAARPVLGGPPEISHSACLAEKRRGNGCFESFCQFIHSGLASRSRRSRLAFQRRRSEKAAGEKKQQDQKEKEEKHGRKKAAPRHPGAKPREGFTVGEAGADTTGPAAGVRKHLGPCEDLFFLILSGVLQMHRKAEGAVSEVCCANND